ncbi:MAG: spermidine synthase, partial [Alphaproteobacteria bacterium]|nr:spermidine synthase [Alphaproteobacteria bacterium]
MLEIVAGRLLAPYVGMSLYSWTAIIAAVLAGLSAGHWLGGRLAGPAIDAGRAARRVGIALILAAFATLAVLPLLRFLAARLIESVDPLPAILVLAGSLFVAPSLLVGIVSPILTRLAIDAQPGDPGRVLGRMYALGALGSIAGTLAAGFLFISWLGTTRTVLAVAGVYALLGLAFLSEARRLALGAALVLIGAGGWIAADEAKRPACAVESDYYCLRAEDVSRLMGRPATALVIDHLAHSINDRFD